MTPDYPRPGAWRDDPRHAQTLCELLDRGAPEQLADIEHEALQTLGANGAIRPLGDSSAYADGYSAGHSAGYYAGTEDGKQDAKAKEKQ